MNINTKGYWDNRFGAGDWEESGGRLQTRQFAEAQVTHFHIKPSFDGTILDFGCALGDAVPVYYIQYPKAKLFGMDLSGEAIKLCEKQYGSLADFIRGNHLSVPQTDIIITSNVLEHLSDHLDVVSILLSKCKELYITVPYKENPLCNEHVNYYDERTFDFIGNHQCKVFYSRGWSQYGGKLYYQLYLKNIFRPLFGKRIVRRRKQIMYHFDNKVVRSMLPTKS